MPHETVTLVTMCRVCCVDLDLRCVLAMYPFSDIRCCTAGIVLKEEQQGK